MLTDGRSAYPLPDLSPTELLVPWHNRLYYSSALLILYVGHRASQTRIPPLNRRILATAIYLVLIPTTNLSAWGCDLFPVYTTIIRQGAKSL